MWQGSHCGRNLKQLVTSTVQRGGRVCCLPPLVRSHGTATVLWVSHLCPLHCGRDALCPVFLFEGSLWPCVHIWSLQCQALEPRLDLTRQMMEFEEQYFNLLASKETVLTRVPQSQEGSLVSLVSKSTHSTAFTSFLPHLVQSRATL